MSSWQENYGDLSSRSDDPKKINDYNKKIQGPQPGDGPEAYRKDFQRRFGKPFVFKTESPGKLAEGQLDVLSVLKLKNSEDLSRKTTSKENCREQSRSSEKASLSIASISDDELYITDTRISPEQERGQSIDHIKFTFEQFEDIRRNTISYAIGHLEKILLKSKVNKQKREESSQILKGIRDDKSESRFKEYGKVVEYAKHDKSILTALEKLKYENDVDHIKFTSEQLKNIGNKKLNISINHLDVLIIRSDLNKQKREESSQILKGIRDDKSESRFKEYGKVVEYAKHDKSILTALEKLA